MARRRLNVSLNRGNAMHVTRVSIGKKKLVYVILADRKLEYEGGRSRIAYIGTTKKGLSRISQSVAARAGDILRIRGLREFDVRVITCPPRQRVKTWCKLERAMLLVFRDIFGEPPWENPHGKRMKEADEFVYFRRKRVRQIIEDLS